MAFGLTLITIDIIHRGKEMDNKLADAKLKMIELGINIDTVDKEYYDRVWGKGCCLVEACAYGSCSHNGCKDKCPPGHWESPCECGKDHCDPGYSEHVVQICTKNTCPEGYHSSGNHTCLRHAHTYDREKICPAGYSVVAGGLFCYYDYCPSGYEKHQYTCHRNPHSWENPNIGAGGHISLLCPEGTKEATPGGICYPTNPPEGYQRHSISVEQWTEKCPDGWEDTGWFCKRPTKSVDKKDAVCPSNSNDIGDDKCKKECEPGYEFKDEKCIQKCPDSTVDNTETTCGREKTIINSTDYEIPYKYRIKQRINDYF
jgi:hypothetical protein